MIHFSQNFSKAMRNPIKQLRIKIELYNSDMQFIKELTEHVTTNNIGAISANRNDPIRRSFSFSLDNKNGDFTWGENNLIWLDKRVKVYTGLLLSNGQVEYLPQGVFAITQPQDSHTFDGKLVTVECHDLAYFLTEGNSPFVNEQIIETGVNCATAIKLLAQVAGITDFLFDSVTETVPYELTYSMNSDRWQAIQDIAAFCKSEVYFDTNGYLRLKKVADLNDLQNESAVWKFYVGDGFYSGNIRKMDSEKTANHIRVLGGSSQTETVIYDLVVDENNSLWQNSPYTVQKIGRKLYFHNEGNPDPLILNSNDAKYRAKFELMNRLGYLERVSLSSAPIYFLEPSDIVEVVDSANGINSRYRIESLQIPLNPEMMTIECSKEEKIISDWNFI